MSRKTDAELLAELESLGIEDPNASQQSNPGPKPATASSIPSQGGEDEDVFRDLQAQLAVKPSTSRPTTPRLSSSTTSGGTKRADHTPASSGPPSGRTSEDRARNAPAAARTSGEGRAYHQSYTPGSSEAQSESAPAPVEKKAEGGGWWGSIFSTATAAVKQAETLAKEIRSNEEAQRWAEQMRGNMKNLQTFGTALTLSIANKWTPMY